MSRPEARRLLARCFAAGLALAAVRWAVLPPEEPERHLVVRVDASADGSEVERATDDAVLLDVALRAGWARSDGVVRSRMLGSLAVVEDVEADPDGAVENALAMGLPSKDVLARTRLITA